MRTKNIFFLCIIVAASGFISPPLALLGGLVYGLSVAHPYTVETRSLSRFLLQASVVLLGFGMNLREVVHAGRSGFFYTAISITSVMLVGLILGQMMGISKNASLLITCGTAICGGSAIAAMAPITTASDEDVAVSMGTVFTLNSIALLIFPLIGYALHLTQSQFGLWAALAIHDTSSVVGATAKYGAIALAVGTTVKLARALWIVPLALGTAAFTRSKARIKLPWFILYFVAAVAISSYVPLSSHLYKSLSQLGEQGLTVTLFLIGTGLSRETLRRVGVRPLVQGVLLWIAIGTISLLAIRAGWIAI